MKINFFQNRFTVAALLLTTLLINCNFTPLLDLYNITDYSLNFIINLITTNDTITTIEISPLTENNVILDSNFTFKNSTNQIDSGNICIDEMSSNLILNQQELFTATKIEKTKLLVSHIWNLTFFFFIFYCITIFSITTYTIPQVSYFTSTTLSKNVTNYLHITTDSMYKFFSTPLILVFIISIIWTSSVVYLWFGQLTLSSLQHSLSLLSILMFTLICYIYFTTLILNSKEIFEFLIVLFNTLVWVFFLFYANNLFTIIFFIEILTSLVFLVLITSSFSSSYNYDVTHFSKTLYFQSLIPTNILNSLIFLFWTSLIASLLLFIFLVFFYMSIFTFEFSLIDIIVTYITSINTFNQLTIVFTTSFLLLIVIFLKSGLVPLFIWKPTVFKGMTLHSIFFYICFYYYFLLLFFVYLLLIDLNDLLCYNRITLITVIMIGTLMLFSILIESYYFKSFLAMSSILNTLLIFLGISTASVSNFFFIL